MIDKPLEPPLHLGEGAADVDPRPEPARWWTFTSSHAPEAVEKVIAQALAVSPRQGKDAIVGSRVHDGYVLRLRAGRKEVAVELRVTGWEGGTQIHVTLPGGMRVARAEECAARVQSLLGETARPAGAPAP